MPASPPGVASGPGAVKILAFKAEDAVGTGAVVFPGDSRGKLDQFGGGKALFQPGAQIVADPGRRGGHRIGQLQHQLFVVAEKRAFAIQVETEDLLVADSRGSASGRVDIDSKRALHQFGRPDLPQSLQRRRNQIGLFERLAEARVGHQHARVSSHDGQGGNVSSETLSCHLPNQGNQQF